MTVGVKIFASTLIAFLVSCSPLEPQRVSTSTFALATARPDYLLIEDYAQTGDNGDWAFAFERAFASEECGPGCAIRLRRFVYDLRTQIDVPKPVDITGVHMLRTQLNVLTGTTAVAYRYAHWATLNGLGTGAEGSSMDDLTIKEVSRPVKVKERVGVLVQAPISMRNVRIDGFYSGVVLDAGAKRGGWSVCETTADCPPNSVCSSKRCRSTYATNANTVFMENIRINGTDGPAVYTTGPDANAGTFSAIMVKGACFRPIGEDATMCAGVREASFLGNYWPSLPRPHECVLQGCRCRRHRHGHGRSECSSNPRHRRHRLGGWHFRRHPRCGDHRHWRHDLHDPDLCPGRTDGRRHRNRHAPGSLLPRRRL